jgi:protein-S-isoprenylcysteine O-methyltransferase Ste14
MLDSIFEVIFLVGLLVYQVGVYGPSVRRYRRSTIADNRMRPQDFLLDMAAFAGWQLIPLVYVLTPWLDAAHYSLPAWAGWVGTGMFVTALWLLWKAYADLGRNWSPTMQIQDEHNLVTHGIYTYIRHPIYAALWLWGCAQPLLLWNWIAGFALLVVFPPLYFIRIPREEKMMLETFGEEYSLYTERTGRIFPRLRK